MEHSHDHFGNEYAMKTRNKNVFMNGLLKAMNFFMNLVLGPVIFQLSQVQQNTFDYFNK